MPAATGKRCASPTVTPPGARAWAVEGAGHYGAAFTRYLDQQSETALEVGRSLRSERRLRGKSDPLDAVSAARSALAAETLTRPRAGERQETLRVLLLARRSAADVRRHALVQLRSVIVTAPEQLREELRRLPTGQLIRRCSRFRRSDSRTVDELAIVPVLRSLARRILAATEEADDFERRDPRTRPRDTLPRRCRRGRRRADRGRATDRHLVPPRPHPQRSRIRPPRRCRATARLKRPDDPHRLSRGGDRQLNRALHTVILHRRQHDPATRDYIARRIADGKTSRNATRLLKRHLARHLYRAMQNTSANNDLTVIGDSLPHTGAGGGGSSRESGNWFFWARALGLAAFGELRARVGLQRVAHSRGKSCEAGGSLGTPLGPRLSDLPLPLPLALKFAPALLQEGRGRVDGEIIHG